LEKKVDRRRGKSWEWYQILR